MERKQFTFYESFASALRRIRKDADRAKAYDAICAYALHGTLPDIDSLPDAAAIAFELIRPTLDASAKKAKSGKAGGNGKQAGSKPEANRKQTGREKEGEIEIEVEKEIENECYQKEAKESPSVLASELLRKAQETMQRIKNEETSDTGTATGTE